MEANSVKQNDIGEKHGLDLIRAGSNWVVLYQYKRRDPNRQVEKDGLGMGEWLGGRGEQGGGGLTERGQIFKVRSCPSNHKIVSMKQYW